MRANYFIWIALIIAWQAVMAASIFYFDLSAPWLHVVEASGCVLPFLGYCVAFYRAPAFAGWSRITKPIALALSFATVTVIGFCFFLLLMSLLFFVFGSR